MKRSLVLGASVLVLLLAGCNPAAGPAGPQGPQGTSGQDVDPARARERDADRDRDAERARQDQARRDQDAGCPAGQHRDKDPHTGESICVRN